MNSVRPEPRTLQSLIALGNCADGDLGIRELIVSLGLNRYGASIHPFEHFEWLREISWADACAVVRAVVRLEEARLTPTRGSVSAIKSIFRTMEDCNRVAAMELAAWIVDHSDNDFIPFPMRKIRYVFERIKRSAGSWAECREALDRWCANEWERQRRASEAVEKQDSESKRRRQVYGAVASRLREEQSVIQHARSGAREKLLASLRSVPVRERLEHIAWDDTRSLSCYPDDFAACTTEDLDQLDPVTRGRLVAKLRQRKKGPWRKLAKRLGLVIKT